MKRWDLYDKRSWVSTEDACDFLHISRSALTYRLARCKSKVPFRIIHRGRTCFKIYNRLKLMRALSARAPKKHVKDVQTHNEASRWITVDEACAIYDLKAPGILYRIGRSRQPVRYRYIARDVESVRNGNPFFTIAIIKEYNAEELDAAMDHFMQRRRSWTGRIPRRKRYEGMYVHTFDKIRIDVQHVPNGPSNIAALAHLGLNPKDFLS